MRINQIHLFDKNNFRAIYASQSAQKILEDRLSLSQTTIFKEIISAELENPVDIYLETEKREYRHPYSYEYCEKDFLIAKIEEKTFYPKIFCSEFKFLKILVKHARELKEKRNNLSDIKKVINKKN